MYRVAIALLVTLLCCGAATFDLGSRDSVEIPAAFTADGIIVRVSIAGRGLDLVLDSGSPNSILDAQVARSVGMTSFGSATANFGGEYTVTRSLAPDMAIGDLHAKDVVITTTAFHRQAKDRRIVGLLGSDFLRSGALEVDFAQSRLILHRSAPAGLGAAGWSSLPLNLNWGVPLIEAAFNGREGSFIADLGADQSVLYPQYFSQLHIAVPPGSHNRGSIVTLAGKPIPIQAFTVKRFALGDWIFGNADVLVPADPYTPDHGYDGLIGRNALSYLDLIFDYQQRVLWFKPIDAGSK